VNNAHFLCATVSVLGSPQVAMQQYSLSLFQMKSIMNYIGFEDKSRNM